MSPVPKALPVPQSPKETPTAAQDASKGVPGDFLGVPLFAGMLPCLEKGLQSDCETPGELEGR